jgi:peptide/nickel transport system permease protein
VLAYVARRIFISIPILIGSSILVFLMVKLAGDPLEPLKLRNPPAPPQTIRLETHRLYLDRPLYEQYWIWLKGLVLHGTFGPSVHDTTNIGHELGSRLVITLRLVLVSVIIALIFAVITGVVSAIKQYSITDYTFTFIGFLFLAMPTFWFAVLLKSAGIAFNQSTGTQTFYTIGDKSVYLADDSTWGHIKDIAGHMILPTIVLGLVGYAAWSRFQRASMLEVLNSDYVRLARAKGLKPRRVLVRHALRTALIPLTTVTALDIAALLGGAVITETVFQWHGMGEFLLRSITDKDAYAMMGWLLVTAIIVVLFNLIADLLYGVLDPRIRYE